jgi:HAD superfamily, subfamily IIIB (Acid phosphatase)
MRSFVSAAANRAILAGAFALVVCGFLTSVPAFAQAPDGCYPIPIAQPTDFSAPPNLDLIKSQVLYYRCTRYDADVAAVLNDARQWVAARAPQVAKPAIVLDIDETSLSNWTRIYRDQFAYFAKGPCRLDQSGFCGDQEWQRSEQAPAIQPTLALYKLARCLGVAQPCRPVDVFFVTGRYQNDQQIDGKTPAQWTAENLDKVGYLGLSPDHLYLRPKDSTGLVEHFKTDARTEIEQKFGVTIIANVGDQASDLVGGHAERTFKVPNPFYFIP